MDAFKVAKAAKSAGLCLSLAGLNEELVPGKNERAERHKPRWVNSAEYETAEEIWCKKYCAAAGFE